LLDNRFQYFKLRDELAKLPTAERNSIMRRLAKTDIFFLCWFIIGWNFYNPNIKKENYQYKLDKKGEPSEEENTPEEQERLYQHALKCAEYPFNFCKMVEEDPDRLWLVARGHMKSLTITVAQNIQDVMNDPEISVALISYNLRIAKSFLTQIKNILEDNFWLKTLFPEILYKNPKKSAKRWNEQDGICVKRKTNRKEETFYGFGLVDSQKTGYHSEIHSFDDMVNENSVTGEDMISKTTARWELSDNLKMMTEKGTRKRYVGTRYHLYDTYATIMKRGIPYIIIPATDDGTLDGSPIFLSEFQWEQMKKNQGSHTTYLQNLLNPKGSKERQLDEDDLQTYGRFTKEQIREELITYILVDPANEKKKKSDYSAFIVVGAGNNGKVYILDIVRDKLNPTERIDMLFELHKEFKPIKVGYEKYGLQSDIHHIKEEMNKRMHHFVIEELGGQVSKEDRIRNSLQPLLEASRLYILPELWYKDYEGNTVDLIESFKVEMESFPVGEHDDMLDALARISDINMIFPQDEGNEENDYVERDSMTGY